MPVNITAGNDNNGDGYAFDRPTGSPRNSLPGPFYVQLDLNLGHEIKLGKRKEAPKLALSLNALNVLNHRNGVIYIGAESSSLFGHATEALPPGQMQLDLQLKF